MVSNVVAVEPQLSLREVPAGLAASRVCALQPLTEAHHRVGVYVRFVPWRGSLRKRIGIIAVAYSLHQVEAIFTIIQASGIPLPCLAHRQVSTMSPAVRMFGMNAPWNLPRRKVAVNC